jgi:hypothetical protein
MSENNPSPHELIAELGKKLNIPLSKIKMAAEKVGYNAGAIKTYLEVRGHAIIMRHRDGSLFSAEERDQRDIQIALANKSETI